MADLIFSKLKSYSGHRGAVYGLCEGPDDQFFSCGGDGYLVMWSTKEHDTDGQLIARTEKPLFCCAFSPKLNKAACGGMDGILYLIDLQNQSISLASKLHGSAIYSIGFYGNVILSAGSDGMLCIMDVRDTNRVKKIKLGSQNLRCLFEMDALIYVGSSDGCIYTIDPATWETSSQFQAHSNSVFSIIADENQLYSGGRDALLKIWQKKVHQKDPLEIKAHMGTVNSLCFYHDWLVSAGRDKQLRIWQRDGKLAESKTPITGGHFHSINKAIWHRKSDVLISASDDKSIIVWQALPMA